MDTLTFRLAEPQHFDQVVALSEGIYEGHDYLPIRFHQWLKQPNRIVMLAFLGHKLIGLQSQLVLDNSETTLDQAKRIHADYRGLGYATQLTEAATNCIRQRFPSIRRRRFVTSYQYSSDKYKELSVLYSLAAYLDTNTFSCEALSHGQVDLKPCTKQYFLDTILSPLTAEKLFPNKSLMVDCCPFEAIHANVDYILEEGDQLFVEQVPEGRSSPSSFSHGRISPRKQFQEYVCSIYSPDSMFFQAHLLKQIESSCNAIQGKFIFISYKDKSFVNQGKEILNENLKLTECEDYAKNWAKVTLYEQTL